MRLVKIKEMSTPGAILLGALIIGLSVFLTTWIFFGGDNNRQKLFTPTPYSMNRGAQPGSPTAQQLQMIQQQQQRAALMSQQASSTPATQPAQI
ncbi:MAG: hypothetical protein WCO09_03975, partial [bacterium]